MLRTYIYVPYPLNDKVEKIAKEMKVSKAHVIREALEHGIGTVQNKQAASADVLLKIAEIGRINNLNGPVDLSTNLDKYLWGNN